MQQLRLNERQLEYLQKCGTKPVCNDFADISKHTLVIGRNKIVVCPACLNAARSFLNNKFLKQVQS